MRLRTLFFVLVALLFFVICLGAVHEAHAGGVGGGKSAAPSAPATPAPPAPAPMPLPDTTPQEAVSRAVRDEERRKLAGKKGVGGAVLAPLGLSGGGGNTTLLGRIGQ